jgi:alpha-amylase/alpha-mannosidase (GH57 family)
MNIAFLWHMHQPYYRDPLSGQYSLPWVRLHALKGYFDMVSILEEFPDIRQTFNLVPSLLRQLKDYANGEARDVFWEHTRIPAVELTPEGKKFILANFFMCNWDTMVKPYPGYFALLLKRGLKVPLYRLDDAISHFTSQDFRDLQVWFNLTWFGYRAREKKAGLHELLQKGRGFSEADKTLLLRIQQEIIQEVIPLYESAQSRGQVEISVSPFYHPILPLLIDWQHAARAMPKVRLPGSFSHPEDAEAQINKAVKYYAELFGEKPLGMWPSEGSVSPELIPLVERAGVRWMASDEGILFKTLPGGSERASLYRPYRVRSQGSEAIMVFRDRNLSDLIGFTYAKNTASVAANDLLNHFKNIQKSFPLDSSKGLILIALDGENPWESYPDGGRHFLRLLYENLSRDSIFRTVRIGDFLKEYPPEETLNDLYTGSWIDQNFRIWIGSPEDNQAWDCLDKTRSFLHRITEEAAPSHPEKWQLAWEEIYIAEGSDWFWWYGGDFNSDNDEEFDRLFRTHLSYVYLLLDAEIPAFLKNPISLSQEIKPTMEPLGLISPIIDGKVTHFYEWREAGYFSPRNYGGFMYREEGFISAIYYGFDLAHFFCRLDPIWKNLNQVPGLQFHIQFLAPRTCRIAIPVQFPEENEPLFILSLSSSAGSESVKKLTSIGSGLIIELGIPFSELGFQPNEKMNFFLTVQREEIELQRYPWSGYFSLIVPDQHFQDTLWQI